jgi:tRNA pseudouridine38-40 synthase
MHQPLDAEAMHQAAQALVGLHDFTTFRSVHCQAASPVKTLDSLNVRREGEWVVIETAARSYLHHQVRSMVGCLALVGMGRWRVEQMGEALEAKERAALGLNAPSAGLYFNRAVYPGSKKVRGCYTLALPDRLPTRGKWRPMVALELSTSTEKAPQA